MGFFDSIKKAVGTASKKVGEFAKKTADDFKKFSDKREKEIAAEEEEKKVQAEEAKKLEALKAQEQAKIDAENAKIAAEKAKQAEAQKAAAPVVEDKKATDRAKIDEQIKTMFCKPTKQELKDELSLLHRIGAIDNDNIYVGGPTNFKSKETLLGSFFKSNKDKTFLSYNNGVFYCCYYNHEEKFMAYKYFLKEDVGSVDINQETMEKKLVLVGKDMFPILTLDITDNSKCLEAFVQLLK